MHTEAAIDKHIGRKILAIVYFIIAACMYYFQDQYIYVGFDLPFRIVFGLVIIFLTFWVFLYTADLDMMALLFKYAFILSLPYFFSAMISIPIWIFGQQGLRVITRGISSEFYIIIEVFALISLLYVFGKNGIWLNFAALLTGNGMLLVRVIVKYGLSQFINDFVLLLTTNAETTTELMQELEQYQLTFSIATYILYFCLEWNNSKNKPAAVVRIAAAVFFFLLGYKRIAVIGIVGVTLIYIFLDVIKANRRAVYIISIAAIAASFGYIVLLFNGIYDYIENVLHIDTMGRAYIASVYGDLCSISPTYLGQGTGFVSRVQLEYTGGFTLQNDYLTKYIDLGFVSYFVWMALYFIIRMALLTHDVDRKVIIFDFCMLLFPFVMAATDVTLMMDCLIATTSLCIASKAL